MSKQVLFAIVLIFAAVVLSGCGTEPTKADEGETANKFEKMNNDLPEGSVSR